MLYIYTVNCCENHIHITCEICGVVKHVDNSKLKIDDSIELDINKSNFYGTCKSCIEESKK